MNRDQAPDDTNPPNVRFGGCVRSARRDILSASHTTMRNVAGTTDKGVLAHSMAGPTNEPHGIAYDAATCTFFVPPAEMSQWRQRCPHDDLEAAVRLAGEHTRTYPPEVRQRIAARPLPFLELDLRWQLFRPRPEPEPTTLAQLARQIRLCPALIYEVLTGKVSEALAATDLLTFYRPFLELGGTGFEPTGEAAADLKRLLRACGAEKTLPTLQQIDVRILQHLYAVEAPALSADLVETLGKGRRTITERLTYLRRLGLTQRPARRRRGETLTSKARHVLEAVRSATE